MTCIWRLERALEYDIERDLGHEHESEHQRERSTMADQSDPMPKPAQLAQLPSHVTALGGDVGAQKQLIQTLVNRLEQQSMPVQLIETHISWVLLAGDVTYKFKKTLQLDFLDYSTLEARRFYCHEEIRLNRRLAPDLYLGVVSINGLPEQPIIDGPGLVLEYAVKMRTLAQQTLWDDRLQYGLIAVQEIDQLASQLVRFHASAPRATFNNRWGTPELIAARSTEDLAMIASLVDAGAGQRIVEHLFAWQAQQHAALAAVFRRRKALGWVRECHGDLHSGNIVTTAQGVAVFDCIEFNDELRWIDVIHDLAFVWMDLQWRGRLDLAACLLNRYLQQGGDYAGLVVLRYYSVQRALVRCKVALLRGAQQRADADSDADADSNAQAQSYLAFASAAISPAPSMILIAHGFSGSGKTTLCARLVEILGAVQLRSDIERKRLYRTGKRAAQQQGAEIVYDIGLDIDPGVGTGFGTGLATRIYTPRVSSTIYLRLRRLAARIAAAGLPVIVDATFLQCAQRRQFQQLALALGLPFVILDVHANPATLRARIIEREQVGLDASDATLAVLEHQLATHEPLGSDELADVIAIDSEHGFDVARLQVVGAAIASRRCQVRT
jgi:aminoglycoside phosphotransferase family enzyme/predicted kinase